MVAPLLIAPSILAADLGHLAAEIDDVVRAGADYIHVDVMDGHFVPQISWGPDLVATARRATTLPLDVHLMVTEPARHVQAFAEAGADIIGIHVEVDPHAGRTLSFIRSLGKKTSLTLNPQTRPENIEYLLDQVDQVLVMSVNPGFGGQKFLPHSLQKIERIANMIAAQGLRVDIEVDGGITGENAGSIVSAGANVLVSGSSIFGHADRKARIAALRAAATGK